MLEKINQVNTLLQSQGNRIIQKMQVGNRPALYGYKPQFIIDAVNEVFGPENWHYQLHDTDLFTSGDDEKSGQVVVSVELFIRASTEAAFVTHGIQFGQTQIIHGNVGDAKKGAVTDAVGKSLSLFSIGKAAYRGELEQLFLGKQVSSSPKLKAVPNSGVKTPDLQPSPPATKQEEITGLPILPKVTYETTTDGTILAQGDTYNNRPLLKSMGFVWLSKEKAWGLKKAA